MPATFSSPVLNYQHYAFNKSVDFSGRSRGGSQGAMELPFATKLLICLLDTE